MSPWWVYVTLALVVCFAIREIFRHDLAGDYGEPVHRAAPVLSRADVEAMAYRGEAHSIVTSLDVELPLGVWPHDELLATVDWIEALPERAA